jgi:hypothetical protein
MKLNSNIIGGIIIWTVIFVLLCHWMYVTVKIDKHKVYTIGKIYKISNGGAHGSSVYYYFYYYKNFRYNLKSGGGRLFGVPNDNNLIYVELDSLKPSRSSIMEFTPVPDCIKFEDAPYDGLERIAEV